MNKGADKGCRPFQAGLTSSLTGLVRASALFPSSVLAASYSMLIVKALLSMMAPVPRASSGSATTATFVVAAGDGSSELVSTVVSMHAADTISKRVAFSTAGAQGGISAADAACCPAAAAIVSLAEV